jgi:hypothetical protein
VDLQATRRRQLPLGEPSGQHLRCVPVGEARADDARAALLTEPRPSSRPHRPAT